MILRLLTYAQYNVNMERFDLYITLAFICYMGVTYIITH